MTLIAYVNADQGFGIGLLLAAFLLGLRHGIDWDHIAAISDITGTQTEVRRGIVLGTFYATGHAVVVFVIGVAAIVAGESLPRGTDAVMGRVVGVTLIFLGIYLAYSVLRYREGFQMRSRWMLILSGVRRVYVAVRRRLRARQPEVIVHEHPHTTVAGQHHQADSTEPAKRAQQSLPPTHTHPHAHDPATDVFGSYGIGTSVGVGMLHGIGAETPTQVLIFLAAANSGGSTGGIVVLAVFLLGLFTSNSVITVGSAFGLMATSRRPKLRIAFGGFTAVMSLALGLLFILGFDSVLPALFGG